MASPKDPIKILDPILSEKTFLKRNGYSIYETIGSGAFGKVYVGQFRSAKGKKQIVLACKVLDIVSCKKKLSKEKLRREIEIMSQIKHPHIIKVHSIFANENKCYIFMRFAENGDLSAFRRINGAVNEVQVRIWIRQLALAIQYLHILEIAHCDIKCKNLLLTAKMNVKLSDFGCARKVVDQKGSPMLCETICGTRQYFAPELAKRKPYNPKCADMWAIGVVIYVLVNNYFPFVSSKSEEFPRVWDMRPYRGGKLSEKVKNAIHSLLEVDCSKRWTVKHLIQSEWIGMDPDLKLMSEEEYSAFVEATDQVYSLKPVHYRVSAKEWFGQHTAKRNTSTSAHYNSITADIKYIRNFL